MNEIVQIDFLPQTRKVQGHELRSGAKKVYKGVYVSLPRGSKAWVEESKVSINQSVKEIDKVTQFEVVITWVRSRFCKESD